jgi:hypothetical protein
MMPATDATRRHEGASATPVITPPITDFVYVDTAINGASNRNHVMPLADFAPPTTARDVYATYFRYTYYLLDHAAHNPLVAPEKRPSVKGFRGVAFASFFPVDFDCAENLNRARLEAIRALRTLEAHYDLSPDAIRIAFSGHKGFSLEIPGTLFGGFTPAADLPHRFRRLARALFPQGSTLDTAIYESVRLWRVLNTRHGRSGLYKIPLTLSELERLTIDEIQGLAAAPRPGHNIPDDEWLPRPDQVALWKATTNPAPRAEPGAMPRRVPLGQRRLSPAQEAALMQLMQRHWVVSQKHHVALGLAGCLVLAGIPEDQATGIFDQLSAEDRRPDDRLRCLRDSYTRHRQGLLVAGPSRLQDQLPPADLDALERLLPTRARLVCGSHRDISTPSRPQVLRTRGTQHA